MDDKEIIRGIKDKEEEVLLEFINTYGKTIKYVISNTIKTYPNLWEEVLNDSILAIWNNIESYIPELSSFKNWCASVAKYKSIDALRKEIRHDSIPFDDLVYEEGELINVNLVEEILACLSEDDQNIFKLLFLEDYSYGELAKMTGLSKEALYKRVSRGKKKIKEEWKEVNHE